MLTKLFSSESIDAIAKELVGQVDGVLTSSAPLPEAAQVPEALYSFAEGAFKNLLQPHLLQLVAKNAPEDVASPDACETVPDTGGLTDILVAVLRNSNSGAALGSQDSVRDAVSSSNMDQSSAGQKHQSLVGVFSSLMVQQLLEMMHKDSVAAQNQQGDLQVQASSVTNEPETTSTGRPSSAASWLPRYEDRKEDNGCFTTVLLLRLLAKMRDAHTGPKDKMEISQQLTEKILAEFTCASGGSPSFQEYLGNVKIQSIYKTMDSFVVKKFGLGAVLRRAENTKDESFDDILLKKLREELSSEHGTEVDIRFCSGYQILVRIKEALATFRRNIGWRLSCHSAVTSSCCSTSTLPAGSAKRHTPSLSAAPAVGEKSDDPARYDPQRYDVMLTKLFSSESIDTIAKELVGQVDSVLTSSAPLTEAAKNPEALYSFAEGAFKNLLQPHLPQLVAHSAPENVASPDACETVPDTGRLTDMLLAVLRNSNSGAALGSQDSVRDAASSSNMDQSSAGQKHQSLVGVFSSVMVQQLQDMMHKDSVAAQNQQGDLQVQASSITNEPETTSTGRPSSAASWLPRYEDRKEDNGCFTTVLLLRLLAKMRDAHTSPKDKTEISQQLTEKILAEFTSASGGSPSFQEYLGNVKIQSIYKTMDTFLVKKFGPGAVLRRAENTQDESFDDMLLMKLREEMSNQYGAEVPAASSALSGGSSSLGPVSEEAGGQTPRKNRWRLKIPKRRSSKVAPVNSASNIGLQGETDAPRAPSDDPGTAVPAAEEQKSRKRPWYHIFTACFRRSS
ncbi:uncharacterized protein LOC134453593 isoform X2 [Engraulis encrasicolus]|uniref:uncharacterized protein LOC134453593 isoform X2 n=1 Tax=Engraulis encrasicolus TaxID=184585 RepID=UPI002FCF1FB6